MKKTSKVAAAESHNRLSRTRSALSRGPFDLPIPVIGFIRKTDCSQGRHGGVYAGLAVAGDARGMNSWELNAWTETRAVSRRRALDRVRRQAWLMGYRYRLAINQANCTCQGAARTHTPWPNLPVFCLLERERAPAPGYSRLLAAFRGAHRRSGCRSLYRCGSDWLRAYR